MSYITCEQKDIQMLKFFSEHVSLLEITFLQASVFPSVSSEQDLLWGDLGNSHSDDSFE